MTMIVSEEQFTGMFRDCDTAWRWEAQRLYRTSPAEGEATGRFLAGDPPSPDEYPEWRDWLSFVRELTAEGKTISRVRIVDDPPTGYQRWAMSAVRWHLEAGEDIRWLPRATAVSLGIPMRDWWLFGTRLVVMAFTVHGQMDGMTLVTDEAVIRRHMEWRHLAARHAAKPEYA